MSGTIESLTRKISGADDLEGVVRSMKALAASSIGQYEKAVGSLDEYSTAVERALAACLRESGPTNGVEDIEPRQQPGIGAIFWF
jgi:F-type H+-transporting ATPase subunit gamma